MASLPTITIDLSANVTMPIININTLVTSQAALAESERLIKENIFTIDFDLLNTNLIRWAALNFPQSHVVYEIPISPQKTPTGQYRCSDGVQRNIWEYLTFVMGCDLATWTVKIEQHIYGMNLSFSVQENPSIVLRLLGER